MSEAWREIQRLVGVEPDGKPGPRTAEAVLRALRAAASSASVAAPDGWRARLQVRLGVRADGVLGPVTYYALFRRLAAAPIGNERTDALRSAAAVHFPAYGIDANPRRLVEFLGEALHETGRFVHLREIWGPTPTQARYEGRRDLGNTQPGDGRRFLGRGIFQLTGRDNYARAARALNLPLVEHPELAERPDIAVLTACWYWKQAGLSALADAGNSDGVSARINRGDPNKVALHLPERRAQKARVRALVE